ncbi:type 1 glutamine amidotransferase domain-containing protein [Rhizosphaericola mali]|uniref:Type 1 glutamine amidotransferase n=1 Tax=Rhizosphaericola mali TaxID=2545455 RepID=A0A5P2FZI1_9BACT|nr:type 1 glutamine amidotransferase domain-containing protein [Rhizosphaericola mali]QES88625.1 type 1 glutamine amidotransferase [Rhizosphaericola mali]
MSQLNEKKVAILSENGFEEVELTSPKQALEAAGVKVDVISPQEKTIKAWDVDKWGKDYNVDIPLDKADASQYNALLLPGGVLNPDSLRINDKALAFIKKFEDEGKIIASICHGPWTLAETGYLKGRKVTSFKSISTDLKNAGADWSDQEVVIDNNLITSRFPDDLPAFNKAFIAALEAK